MTTEFNELLSVSPTEKSQIWIIGMREQVLHTINEFYVKRIATDFPAETLHERVKFMPIIPAPFEGKYIALVNKESALCGASHTTQQRFSYHAFFLIAEAICLF